MTSHVLTHEVQRLLIQVVKTSIGYYLSHSIRPDRDILDAICAFPLDATLEDPKAAFVTLRLHGELRGCIGSILPSKPLVDDVIYHSINAAFHDSRFMPVTESEYPHLTVEISVLSKPRPIRAYHDIDIKTHGIIFKKLGRSALFLPKVASEQGWGLATTLTHLCHKAGLKPDDWKNDAQFEVFEAFEFKEA